MPIKGIYLRSKRFNSKQYRSISVNIEKIFTATDEGEGFIKMTTIVFQIPVPHAKENPNIFN
jgi:hypothetical protein